MSSRQHTTNLLRAVTALMFAGAFFSRCASIMTPEGGPKDTIPPVIVRMSPDNRTTNFNEKRIFIEFNEFVQIKDQGKEFYTSPAMKKLPLLATKGKGVVVTIRDTLRENTTYALDFGSAIRDNNEGNPLNGMRYVFSTGETVDSLICSGYTADSYKADSVSRTYLWFYIADSLPSTPDYDSTIFNRKPDVIARAQNNGIFIAQNLKPIDYRVYAVADKNDNRLYDAGSDLVGLLDSVVNPTRLPDFAMWFDSLRMYMSAEPQLYFRMFTDVTFRSQRLVEASRPDCKKVLLYFNTALPDIEKIELDSIASDHILYDPQTKGKDTVALWLNVPAEQLPDTIKGNITYFRHDSIRQYVRTTEPLKLAWRKIETKEEEREREKREKEKAKAEAEGREWTAPEEQNPFKCTFSAQNEINPERGFDMKLEFPVVQFDSSGVRLVKIDKDNNETVVESHFILDTLNRCRYAIRSAWQPATKYRFTIPAEAMTDVMGYKNDSLKVEFATFDPEKYATVTVKVHGEPGKAYILQLTDGSSRTLQEITNVVSGQYRFNYVSPGEVRLRIIEDTNRNGQWDAGNVVERRQPERAEMYMNERGEDLFVTKMNWDIEITTDMSKVFVPMTMENIVRSLDEKEAARLKKLAEDMAEKEAKNKGKSKSSAPESSGGMMGGFSSGMNSMRNIGSGQMGGGMGGMR